MTNGSIPKEIHPAQTFAELVDEFTEEERQRRAAIDGVLLRLMLASLVIGCVFGAAVTWVLK